MPKNSSKRKPIPPSIQSELLLANRHACCVCQKSGVQIHHIDGDPANNDIANLSALCLSHHDMATMEKGLTKKLQPDQVKKYKATWEDKCKADILALARDRVNFYVALYKNPPRIWELFIKQPLSIRTEAIIELKKLMNAEEEAKSKDAGFSFQAVPKNNDATKLCFLSAFNSEIWPEWLSHNSMHPEDPNYPNPADMGPPHGMQAFHFYDLYCQILVQILTVISPPVPLEYLIDLKDEEKMDAFSGRLVVFRERAYGKNLRSPRSAEKCPISRVQFVKKKKGHTYRTEMQLRNMYVFSDTAAENLKNSRVCGVGIFGGAIKEGQETKIKVIPLMMGMGGLGRSDASGWGWTDC